MLGNQAPKHDHQISKPAAKNCTSADHSYLAKWVPVDRCILKPLLRSHQTQSPENARVSFDSETRMGVFENVAHPKIAAKFIYIYIYIYISMSK